MKANPSRPPGIVGRALRIGECARAGDMAYVPFLHDPTRGHWIHFQRPAYGMKVVGSGWSFRPRKRAHFRKE